MTQRFIKTKPSFLEAGLPCASLSAECQRDNNARERPPQNRLHIWWARRPPTVCRVAILTSLLPFDLKLGENLLPNWVVEPTLAEIGNLPGRLSEHTGFYGELLAEVQPTQLPDEHRNLLRAMGITGDGSAAYRRMAFRDERSTVGTRVPLPDVLVYRHPAAFAVSPSAALIGEVQDQIRKTLSLGDNPIVILDSMAGGGAIPLEGVRFGAKVFANDLNPVASLVLKATLEYPTRFGRKLRNAIEGYARQVNQAVSARLSQFFSTESEAAWWPNLSLDDRRRLQSKQVTEVEPGGPAVTRDYLWLRVLPCPKCALNIPLSTNLHIVLEKNKPGATIAAFPEIPATGDGNDCTFRIVSQPEWSSCKWPRLGNEEWHPRNTPTYKDGRAVCPRCGNVVDEDTVKSVARSRPGGLPSQMYAVCSQVPVRLTYRGGETKIRFLWRFRAPTPADLEAVRKAERELAANEERWASLIPTELIPEESNYNRGHRLFGMTRWRDMFLPRQLLTCVTILDELLAAGRRARAELPPAEAEGVAVYLAFILSKVVNYNSVNTFWHYERKTVTQTFSRHNFAFRPAFCEFEGARETVLWAASQVISAYEAVAGLIHGEAVSLEGGDDEEADDTDQEPAPAQDEADTTGESGHTPSPCQNGEVHLRPEVIVPTVTCNDAAALDTPAPGTVHLICVDPPYYGNVQYSELSNYFYVWLKRALANWPGLEPLFRDELAESNREAVANTARWKREAEQERTAWQGRYEAALVQLEGVHAPGTRRKLRKEERQARAREVAGPEPATAAERAERFYEDKMAAVFRRARQLLHPAGRMVVMFNHKMTQAWRALGAALIREGFEIRTSIPIHTEAESSLHIRGLDAARSTVLLLCLPREETSQVTGNWGRVQSRVADVARNAAARFQVQGLSGTDLYLSALGPALGEVGRHWPITDMAGRPIDLGVALDEAYRVVARFRLEQILTELTTQAAFAEVGEGFTADSADKNTQSLWLWLDTFQGDVADSDDVRKLAKSLDIEPDAFRRMKLLDVDGDTFILKPPQAVNLGLLARNLLGGETRSARDREARAADVWDERKFPGFMGAAVWNAIALMAGAEQEHRGLEALKQWLRNSGHGEDQGFRGAFAVTLYLLRQAFGKRRAGDPWQEATTQAGVAWDLAVKPGRR